MKVTQEADYAIRMCCALDMAGTMLDTTELSERAAITKSIALKVLRKLKESGIVESVKGAEGGYLLRATPEKLTVLEIIEAVEGRIYISKCLDTCHECSLNGKNKLYCKMHVAFSAINNTLTRSLASVTVRMITDSGMQNEDIINQIKN